MPARIYQTVHDGALAFLIVVSSTRKVAKKCAKMQQNATKDIKSLRLDMAEIAGPNPAEPIVLFTFEHDGEALGRSDSLQARFNVVTRGYSCCYSVDIYNSLKT
jgi:hypothetical protein